MARGKFYTKDEDNYILAVCNDNQQLIDSKKYKMFVFLNAFSLTKENRDHINHVLKKDGKAIVFIFFDRASRADRVDRSNRNVAIKRGQRLLADYAEREQRKDCEAGLIIGV